MLNKKIFTFLENLTINLTPKRKRKSFLFNHIPGVNNCQFLVNFIISVVKLAVASGHLVFSLVGDEESSHYLMTGDPIYAIKTAESKSSAGEIVITARVSRHISANEYLLNVLPDGLHAKVIILNIPEGQQ